MDQQQKTAPPVYDLSQGGHYGASAAVSPARCDRDGWRAHQLLAQENGQVPTLMREY
jgi:hypothetical protein